MSQALDGGLMKVIYGIIAVVILFTAAPELWTILNNALGNISAADIPLVSGMTGIVGLVFGAVVLIGGLFYLFKLFKGKR